MAGNHLGAVASGEVEKQETHGNGRGNGKREREQVVSSFKFWSQLVSNETSLSPLSTTAENRYIASYKTDVR